MSPCERSDGRSERCLHGRRRRRERYDSGSAGGELLREIAHAIGRGEHRIGALEELGAGGRDADAPAAPLEEPNAELVLERPDALPERRLAQVETFGGRAKRARADDLGESPELTELQRLIRIMNQYRPNNRMEGIIASRQAERMSEANKTVMRRIAAEVLDAKNLTAAAALVAADCVDHSAFPGQPPGLEGMRARWSMLFEAFPDFRITIHDIIAEGDVVALRTTGRGTHKGAFFGIPPTGKSIVFHETNFNRIVDGKLVEHWADRSNLEVMQQLGALPR